MDRVDLLLELMTISEGSDDAQAAWDKLVPIIEACGAKVRFTTNATHKLGWDGETISICNTISLRAVADLCHEFAHLQASSPLRRHLAEFGLGQGFDTADLEAASAAYIGDHKIASLEENAACILAVLWLNQLGLATLGEAEHTNFAYFADDEQRYVWSDDGLETSNAFLLDLMEKWGLIKIAVGTIVALPVLRADEADPDTSLF